MLTISNKDEFVKMLNNRSGLLIARYEEQINKASYGPDTLKTFLINVYSNAISTERLFHSQIFGNLSFIYNFIQKSEFLEHIMWDVDKKHPVNISLDDINNDIQDFINIYIKNINKEVIAKIQLSKLDFSNDISIEHLLDSLGFSLMEFHINHIVFYKNKINTFDNINKFNKLNNKISVVNNILHPNYHLPFGKGIFQLKYRDFSKIDQLPYLFDTENDKNVSSCGYSKLDYDMSFIDCLIFVINEGKTKNFITKRQLYDFFNNYKYIKKTLNSKQKYSYTFSMHYDKEIRLRLGLGIPSLNEDDNVLFINISHHTNFKCTSSILLYTYTEENGTSETHLTLHDYIWNEEETLDNILLLQY